MKMFLFSNSVFSSARARSGAGTCVSHTPWSWKVLSRQPLHKIMPNPDNGFRSMPAGVSLDVIL